MSKKIIHSFSYEEFNSVSELPKNVHLAVERAKEATNRSYANYSDFLVGAALILESGEIIESSNQENASYPNGLCAESLAFFYASSKHPEQKISAIVITARKRSEDKFRFTPPCGSCRQVMLEYEESQGQKIPVYLAAANHLIYKIPSVCDLLPLSFSGADLE
ncbi:MAG: cytidine deaminase [Bacteroidota bacterium]